MKKFILAGLFFLIFTSFMSLKAQWARTYGGGNVDEANFIQQTSDGGYIVAGITGQNLYAGINGNIWILKLSSTADIEWQKVYGEWDGVGDKDTSIKETIDGGYIVLGDMDNPSILKLYPNGEVQWGKFCRKTLVSFYSIQLTADGGYIVAGRPSPYSGGGGFRNILVLKLNSEGNIEWQKAYFGNSNDGINSIQQTDDGGYIATGYTSSFGAEGNDVLVLKLTHNGEIEWQRSYGRSDYDEANCVQQTTDGGYIVAGKTNTNI